MEYTDALQLEIIAEVQTIAVSTKANDSLRQDLLRIQEELAKKPSLTKDDLPELQRIMTIEKKIREGQEAIDKARAKVVGFFRGQLEGVITSSPLVLEVSGYKFTIHRDKREAFYGGIAQLDVEAIEA